MDEENTIIKYPFEPTWCPGCGNFSIWAAIKNAVKELGISPEKFVLFYDVGCSGDMTDFNCFYGFHTLHGRAIATAVGTKLANHDLKVIVIIGDGGCYGEGGTHFINLMRGNHDVCVLVHNNHRYSLTTGQMSPTTEKGTKTKSTPEGSIEEPMNPVALALSNHGSFIAREFALNVPRLTERIKQAVNHVGFAVIDILQPCVTFNREQDVNWYQQRLVDVEKLDHKTSDLENAWKQAMRKDKLPIGLFFKEEKPAYHQQVSTLQNQPLIKKSIEKIDITNLLKEFE